MKASINQKIILEEQAKLSITDQGVSLGNGLFETIKYQNNEVQFFEEHWQRLNISANILSLPLPYTSQEVFEQIQKLISENQLKNQTCSIRLMLTAGACDFRSGAMDIESPNFVISVKPYEDNSTQATAVISAMKINQHDWLNNLKTTSYLDKILMQREAARQACSDAIILNLDNHVVETARANIFIVKNNQVITPPLTAGCLPGIMRTEVIKQCQHCDISITEEDIKQAQLLAADEIFITNSLIGMRPITEVFKKLVIPLDECKMTKYLQEALINEIRTS